MSTGSPGRPGTYTPLIDVLFACTGNICRSPIAEGLLRARLAERAPEVTIGSVGQLFDGRPAEPEAVAAMADRGIDISGHLSRRQTAELITGTSLILGMERAHVRELSVLVPGTFAHTFTLPEFVRLVEAVPPRSGEDLLSWVEGIGAGRDTREYLLDEPDDEVADPMGRPLRVFRSSLDGLDDLVSRMVERVWPES